VGGVFSPLDEVLALVPGSLSPHLLEGLVRVSSRLPFAQAAAELAFFWQAVVSDETARRVTEQAGTAYVGVHGRPAGVGAASSGRWRVRWALTPTVGYPICHAEGVAGWGEDFGYLRRDRFQRTVPPRSGSTRMALRESCREHYG